MSLTEIVAIEGYIQTTYLAVYPHKLLLLDGGCRCDVEKILTYITDTLKRPVSELKTVMVTHMHPDHAGGAALLKQETGCQIVTASTSKPWYKGVKGRANHINDLALTFYVASRQGKSITNIWYDPILKPDIEVVDGNKVPHFEDWTVLETPGHTDRDLSLWHEPSKQVYTADLILKIRKKFISPYLITLPYSYRDSLKRVKALEPDTILLAHGEKASICAEDFDILIEKTPDKPRHMTLVQGLHMTFPQLQFARKRVGTP